MLFIFGSRLFGKVDIVPGMFHVATKFGHVNYLPLIPMQSYIVLSKSGGSFRGLPISLSGKSILIAWGRVVSFIAMGVGVVGAIIQYDGGRGTSADWGKFALTGVIGAAAFAWVMWYRGCTHASFNRACALARQIGLNEAGMQHIQRIYGKAAARGFDVIDAAPKGPPLPPLSRRPGATAEPAEQWESMLPPIRQETDASPEEESIAAHAEIGLDAAPPSRPTFFVHGRDRDANQEVCVTVWADDENHARQVGEQRGIDVTSVESATAAPARK